ncbi:hypothetical protein EW145_g3643 [Phellinidium pouzarii]|uniref:SMP-30/Gluconolactonase/LRE-like region domain-containing protein n=1 Tax=Phellinidium pouzarii TaxID=167371 RepID=A0A4S4L6P1_9AGAM|nr:hypothetical protein EW145_g3643 [Phellinidium pouzarii]
MKGYLFLASFLVYAAWRTTHVINALTRPDLPHEYFGTASGPKDASSQCSVLRGADNKLSYCEDQTFWEFEDAQGHVFDRKVVASCDPNRKNWNTVMGPLSSPDPLGGLWLVEYDRANASAKEMKLVDYPERRDFHPLGVAIWPSKLGSTSNMFVVNHGRHRTTIEQFLLDPADPSSAKFIRTLSSKYFISPNALALTSPSSFFVSNDHFMTRRLPSILGEILPVIETFIGLPLGFISHVSIVNEAMPGAAIIRHTIPKLGISFPNGIALSPDGQTLAVASSSYTRVLFYNRTSNEDGTEKLTYAHAVSVPFAPDNVHYDDTGALLVAGHPYFPGLIAVAENKTTEGSPSWVAELTPRTQGGASVRSFDLDAPFSATQRVKAAASHGLTTLYQSDGSKFSGSTTGLRDTRSGTLFVVGLFEEGLLICRP